MDDETIDLSLIKHKRDLYCLYFVNRHGLSLKRIAVGFSSYGVVRHIEATDPRNSNGEAQRILIYYGTLEEAKQAVKGLHGASTVRLRPHPRPPDDDSEDEEGLNWNGCKRRLFPEA